MPATSTIDSPASLPGSSVLRQKAGSRAEAWRGAIVSRRYGLALTAIVLAGMALRLYETRDRSLWFDEAASWRLSRLPWSRLIGAVGRDNNVPLHHAMLKVWTWALGDSVLSMRSLSALLSAGAIAGVYALAREAFRETRPGRASGQWIGLMSAALVAVSLPQIRAGWEVRMYSLGTALVALGGWTLFRALHATQAEANRRWAFHGLVTLGMAYTHPYLLFSVAAQALFLSGYFLLGPGRGAGGRPKMLRAAVTYAAVGAGWALWVPVLLAQARQVRDSFWTGTLSGWDVVNQCYEMFLDGSAGSPRAAAVAAAVCCAGVLAGLAWAGRPGHSYVLLLAAVPFGAGAGVSLLGRNIFLSRYLVFAQLFVLMGLASLLAAVPMPRARNVLAAILVLAGAVVAVAWVMDLDIEGKPGMRAAVGFLKAHRKPGEPVVATVPHVYFPADYYMKERGACRMVNDGLTLPHYNGGAFVEDSDLILRSRLAGLGPGRVWVIGTQPRVSDFDAPAEWRLIDDQEFPEVFTVDAVFVDQFEVPARH